MLANNKIIKSRRAFIILWVVICILGFLGQAEELFGDDDNRIASFTADFVGIIYFPFGLWDSIWDPLPVPIMLLILLVLPFLNGYLFVVILTKIYNWFNGKKR